MSKIGNAKQFYTEARQELKKVVWPTKQQTLSSTKVVVIFVAIISMFLGLSDLIFGKIINFILS